MLVTSRPPAASPSNAARTAALGGGARVDVCILGGGLAELVAAYLLAREKHAVMVLHDGPLGGPHAPPELGHLGNLIEAPYEALEREHGAENARLAARSYGAAVEALESIVRRERIACEFERLDAYRFHEGPGALAQANAEVQAAHRADASDVELVAEPPVEGARRGPCVRYPRQASFHPQKLLAGLARAVAAKGGRVHVNVEARPVEDGPPGVVTSAGHRVDCRHVVAANAPRIRVQVRGIGLRIPRGSATRALYAAATPGLLGARLRSIGSAETLLVAGDTPEESLATWARTHFPRAAASGQRFQGELQPVSDVFTLTSLDGDMRVASAESWGSPATRALVAGMAIRDFVVGARAPAQDPAQAIAPALPPSPARA